MSNKKNGTHVKSGKQKAKALKKQRKARQQAEIGKVISPFAKKPKK